jgi:hypothetical protein
MVKTIILSALFLLLLSCTQVRYNVTSHEIRYISLLQKKTLSVSITTDPMTGKENIQVVFSTNSDPAVQMFQAALSAAAQAAVMYGLPAPVTAPTLRQPAVSDVPTDLPPLKN